jgi:hypothetical protein
MLAYIENVSTQEMSDAPRIDVAAGPSPRMAIPREYE